MYDYSNRFISGRLCRKSSDGTTEVKKRRARREKFSGHLVTLVRLGRCDSMSAHAANGERRASAAEGRRMGRGKREKSNFDC